MRMGKARKSLAIFSGLLLKKVIKVRRLIFKLCYLRTLHITVLYSTTEGSRAEGWGAMPSGKGGEYKRHNFSSLLTNLSADLESYR
jgi:hypothetical protein